MSDESEEEREEFQLKLRHYQQEIIKQCIKQNSIVYLPTGAGKTIIAEQVIKQFSNDAKR